MSPLPSNLEKVAEAGGWDERQAEKAMEFMEKASKIKEREWKAMTGTLGALKDIVDAGGLEGMFDRLGETWSLQVENALSPLVNEVSQLVAEALKPIMPMINATLNEATDWITISVGSWEAIFTGKWDEVFKDISAKMPAWMIDFKNMVNQWWYDVLTQWQRDRQAQIAAGTAAGQAALSWANDVNQWWYELWGSLGWR